MRFLYFFVLLVSAVLLNSCALALTGKYQRMRVVTDVPGAQVWVNGEYQDSTPCVVKLKRSFENQPAIVVRKVGYKPQEPELKGTFNEVSSLNFILPWNWLIDGFSGAIVRYKQIDTLELKPTRR
jgi:hypothetical protein